MSEFGMSFEEAARGAKEGARAIREAMARDSYPVTAPDARQSDELREALARWMFERSETWRDLCSPEDADWDEWVERNREAWREEADVLLSLPMVTAWAEKQARERAAAELRKAAEDVRGDFPALTTGVIRSIRSWLRARAAALAADDRTDPA